MQVAYATRSLEKLCTDEKEMRRKRADVAVKLRLRIKALETAENVSHLKIHDPMGRWHALTADLAGQWAGWLSPNHRIIIRPEGGGPPATRTAVTVMELTDYH